MSSQKSKKSQKLQQQLKELETLAHELGITIRYDTMTGMGIHRGGLCKIHGKLQIIIDRRLKEGDRIQMIADALQGFDIAHFSLSPQIRQLLVSQSV